MIINAISALVISSILALGAGMTTVQIIRQAETSEEHSIVARQSQNLGFSVSQDMVMARMVSNSDNTVTPDTEFITLIWKDWETGYKYDVRYIWADDSAQLKEVFRKQAVFDETGQQVNTTSTLLANNIYTANLTRTGGAWLLTVESHSGDKVAVREYEINRRVY
jgi:hypothetical protein